MSAAIARRPRVVHARPRRCEPSRSLRRVLVALLPLAFAACHHAKSGLGDASPTLLSRDWRLVGLASSAAPSATGPGASLRLDPDQRATGFTGCNRFSASYQIEGDSIRFDGFRTTRRACTQGLEVETTFLRALEDARTYRVRGGELQLLADDRVLARFAQ